MKPVSPPPAGWPRISSAVFYDDAAAAIDWLCRVFGFEVQMKVEGEGGRIVHSQLIFGEGLVMVGQTRTDDPRPRPVPSASPRSVGGKNTQALALWVDDVDAHCARVQQAGGTIVEEPTTNDYGPGYWTDRTFRAEDLEGHHWWFMQRLRTG